MPCAAQGLEGSARRYVMSLLASTSGYHRALPLPKHSPHATGAAAAAAAPQALQPPTSLATHADTTSQPHTTTQHSCCCSACHHTHRQHAQQQQPQQQPGADASSGHTDGSSAGLPPGHSIRYCRVPFHSQCEHHMLPFYGSAQVAYVVREHSTAQQPQEQQQPQQQPSEADQISGQDQDQVQDEIGAIVSMYTQRLQVQERITHQVADAVAQVLGCPGVMVVVDAAHMCMVARGVENHSGRTTSFATRGLFAGDAGLRREVLRACRMRSGQQ